MHPHDYVHNVENVTDVVKNLWEIHHRQVSHHHHRHHHHHHDHHHHHHHHHLVSHHPSIGEEIIELPEDCSANHQREVVQHCQGDDTQPLEI